MHSRLLLVVLFLDQRGCVWSDYYYQDVGTRSRLEEHTHSHWLYLDSTPQINTTGINVKTYPMLQSVLTLSGQLQNNIFIQWSRVPHSQIKHVPESSIMQPHLSVTGSWVVDVYTTWYTHQLKSGWKGWTIPASNQGACEYIVLPNTKPHPSHTTHMHATSPPKISYTLLWNVIAFLSSNNHSRCPLSSWVNNNTQLRMDLADQHSQYSCYLSDMLTTANLSHCSSDITCKDIRCKLALSYGPIWNCAWPAGIVTSDFPTTKHSGVVQLGPLSALTDLNANISVLRWYAAFKTPELKPCSLSGAS